jgi:hypothetical protein
VVLVPDLFAEGEPAGSAGCRPVRLHLSRPALHLLILIEQGDAEVCAFDPGYRDDLVVTISDPVVFARWHLELIDWAAGCIVAVSTSPGRKNYVAPSQRGTAPFVFAHRRASMALVAGVEPAEMDVPSL